MLTACRDGNSEENLDGNAPVIRRAKHGITAWWVWREVRSRSGVEAQATPYPNRTGSNIPSREVAPTPDQTRDFGDTACPYHHAMLPRGCRTFCRSRDELRIDPDGIRGNVANARLRGRLDLSWSTTKVTIFRHGKRSDRHPSVFLPLH